MPRPNQVRLAEAAVKASQLKTEVEALSADLPWGRTRQAAQQAVQTLNTLRIEAEGEIRDREFAAESRKRSGAYAAQEKARRAAAGSKEVAGVRAQQGYLQHAPVEGQAEAMTGVWFHGSTESFERLGARSPRSATRGFNPRLGLHFTADHQAADAFAFGLYRKGIGRRAEGKVYAVRLKAVNPKVFASERALNGDFFEFCLRRKDLRPQDIEPLRSYRRIPKGDPDGPNWWEKIAVSAGADLAEALPHLEATVEAYRQHLRVQGHDGVVYLNDIEGWANPCCVVFDDIQVEVLEVLGKGAVWDKLGDGGKRKDYQRELAALVLA